MHASAEGRRHSAELLAPAGSQSALRAALAAGADAVYLGLRSWSARAFAGNFDDDGLLQAIDAAHLHGASVHLALNTLVKDDEIGPALVALEAPYRVGLDAVLVADLGLAAAIREHFPDLSLHASTQLGTHSDAQLALLAGMGFSRAVLARELSLQEIRELDAHGLGLEAFVHGALCYGYSGACLFSSMVGGRSGNRGRCAQACRMRYSLQGGPAARVLSTADLNALDSLPALLLCGVSSFKIEGRMKDAAYVATAVSVYREALDEALADPAGYRVRDEWLRRLEQSFSRTFTSAHLAGRHSEVRSGGRGGHRGVLIGRAESVDEERGSVVFRLTQPVSAGDVVCVYTSRGQTEPVRVAEARSDRLALTLREHVSPKDRLFRLTAAAEDEMVRDLLAGRRVARPVHLDARLRAREGSPAELVLEQDGVAGQAESSMAVVPARAAPLTPERVRDALGALGGTPYRLQALALDLGPGLFLPVSELKDMRRRALAEIDARRLAARRRDLAAGASPASSRHDQPPEVAGWSPHAAAGPRGDRAGTADGGDAAATPGRLATRRDRAAGAITDVVLRVRPDEAPLPAPAVVAVAIDCEVEDDVAVIEAAFQRVLSAGLRVRCRPPQVLFDADMEWWAQVSRLPWSAVYARHPAHLAFAGPVIVEYPLIGLNAAGVSCLVRDLAGSRGSMARGAALPPSVAEGTVVSPELSLAEIAAFVARLAEARLGLVIEALVVGRERLLLSRDRLGEAEGIAEPRSGPVSFLLEDAKGYRFPVEVRRSGTSIFNAVPTDLSGHLAELAAAGVGRAIVQQAELSGERRSVFAREGLAGLARAGRSSQSTTGHLFRGVS